MNTHFCSSFVALFQRMTLGHEEPWRLAALTGALARSTRNMAAASASAKCALSLRIVTLPYPSELLPTVAGFPPGIMW